MTNLSENTPEMPEERRERSERSDGGFSGGRAAPAEVSERAKRRTYTAEYKMKILEEIERCHLHGQVGLLLRREGLYSGILTSWRKWRDKMRGQNISSDKKGSKDFYNENARLKRENNRLLLKLKKAEGIIDLQKKISEMLDLNQQDLRKDKV